MLSKNVLGFLVAVASTTVVASPLVDDGSRIPGYGVEDLEWVVQATRNGPLLNLTGTAEQVYDELVHLNPNIGADFPVEPGSTLQARTNFGGSKYNCNTNKFGLARKKALESGVRYLWRVGGRPANGPGPGNCGRVSCSYDSANWWRNDSKSTKRLESFSSIADGAQFIINKCSFNNGYNTYASGQVFHKTQWNVINQAANC